jgi:uncharacterized integral membrane protein
MPGEGETMKKKLMVYAAWLQIILVVIAVYALRWDNSETSNSEFFLEFWWVWPAVLILLISGAGVIISNRR